MEKIEKLGFYIHVPFCKQKCLYCDFFSCSNFDNSLFEKYFDYLIRELSIRLKDYYNTHSREQYIINTIYIGGGTPSIIPTYIYESFLPKLFSILDINNIDEMTIEMNPESVSQSLVDYISSYSFARLSLGIQTTNDISLMNVGRIAKCSDIDNALKIISNSSIKNTSVDFIHSLPNNMIGQSKKDIAYVLDRLNVEHISFYFLEIDDEHMMKKKWDSISMNEDDSVVDYLSTLEYLYCRGFNRYEISNFAISGKYKSQHNNHYWDLDNYIGIGLSACGCYNDIRYTNTYNLKEYFSSLDSAMLEQDIEVLNSIVREKEFIFLALRKTSGIDTLKYQTLFKGNFFDKYEMLIKKYESYFVISKNSISLTDIGMLHANTIISSFFE